MSHKRRMIIDSNGYMYPPLHFRDGGKPANAFVSGVSTLRDVDELLMACEDLEYSLSTDYKNLSPEILNEYRREFGKQRRREIENEIGDTFARFAQSILRADPSEALKKTALNGEAGLKGLESFEWHNDRGRHTNGVGLELYYEENGIGTHGVVFDCGGLREWLATYFSGYEPERLQLSSEQREEDFENFIVHGKYTTTYAEEKRSGYYAKGYDAIDELLEEHDAESVSVYIMKINGVETDCEQISLGNDNPIIDVYTLGLEGATCDALLVFDEDPSNTLEIHGLSLEQGTRCDAIAAYATFEFNENSYIPVSIVRKCNTLKAEMDNAIAELERAESENRRK